MPNQAIRQKTPIDLYIDCVVLTSFTSEFTFLRNIFRISGIRMHHADSLDEASFLLTVTESTVLLADMVFAGGLWHDALSLLSNRHPTVTMLVVAEPADRPFLDNLFSRGACGVIWKPIQFEAARKLIRAVHEASKERRALQMETLSPEEHSRGRSSLALISDARHLRSKETVARGD